MKLMISLAVAMLCTLSMTAQEKPQVKVDVSINGRSSNETQEPGYEWWCVTQGKTSNSFETGGLKFTFTAPEVQTPDYIIRSGWNKTLIQNATNKAKNGRLTFDGVSLDPNDNSWIGPYYGQITLKIEGLPAGNHTLMTYHNWWGDSIKNYAAPISIRCNGQLVADNVLPTIGVSVAADVTIATIPINVAKDSDVVDITFATSADKPGEAKNGQTGYYSIPLLNGFELNTVNVSTQAKNPTPADGDMHLDADSKQTTLKWEAAGDNVKEHRLYTAIKDASALVLTSTLPKGTTSYEMTNLYSMNTYYWRVDEVDEQGNVVEGKVWSFRPRQLAFPNAEGYGRFAQGGRGGVVYHVTNLKGDETPGSLLYGLLALDGPRTIVFDVSGIIDLGFKAYFPKDLVTIAGQTAPGKGVCIKGANINISSDAIVRHMRFKRGLGVYGMNTGNAMGMSGANHSIVDHCTAAWGTDETVSGRGAKNVTFQYSIISEALGIAGHKNYPDGSNHGFAATIDGKIGSWHHNLLVNCNGRNWSMGGGMDGENRAIGQMDIFNNVCYNWYGRTTDGNCHELNFVSNYYKMGPDTKRTQLLTLQYENIGHPESTWRAYVSGNIRENKNRSLTQDALSNTYDIQLSNGDIGPQAKGYEPFVDKPFFPSYAQIHSAQDAMKIVTSYAGATMPIRDEHHQRNIRETIDGTYTYVGSKSNLKGEIDTEMDITEHSDGKGWEVYPEVQRGSDWDTDLDGMPNWYEKLIGSDHNTANNNDDPDHNGWTLLEDYLEFMAHPYEIIEPYKTASINIAPYFKGFFGFNGNKVVPTFSIESGSPLFEASISETTINVKANGNSGFGIITMKVKDNDGSEFSQRLSIAVTGEVTGLNSAWQEEEGDIVNREFFTLDGRKVSMMQPHETYIMRTTDSKGRIRTVKIIKN